MVTSPAPHGPLLPAELQLPDHPFMEMVARLAARNPRGAWLDLLARHATGGRHDSAALAVVTARDLAEADPAALAHLAWVRALVATDLADLQASERLFRAVFGGAPPRRVHPRAYDAWLQVLLLTGELDTAPVTPTQDQVHPDVWWAVHTDALNPGTSGPPETGPEADVGAWLAALNAPFTRNGLEPLTLAPLTAAGAGLNPLDRLRTAGADRVDGELISVIMPVYNPTEALLTSVRSVLAQTWENVEVIIVDDASSTGHDALEESASLSDRVRLIRLHENRGAYSARNRGLAAARGTLITFQDADDYSHPRRFELSSRPLFDRPTVVASVGRAIRATDKLLLTQVGYWADSINLSSFMFRRDPVLTQLGGFDTVRRGGDSEFSYRVRREFGDESVDKSPPVLAVTRRSEGSLSAGEVGILTRHPARVAYAAAARAWHRTAAPHRGELRLLPPVRAPFPAPTHIRGTSATSGADLDVVILAPIDAGVLSDSLPVADALTRASLRVGLHDYVGPRATAHRAVRGHDRLGTRVAAGDLTWLLPGEPAHAGMVLVTDPLAVFTMPPDTLNSLTTEQVLVAAAPGLSPELAAAATSRLHEATGAKVRWLPQTAAVASYLAGAGLETLDPLPWGLPRTQARAWRPAQFPVVGVLGAALGPVPQSWLPVDPATPVWRFGRGPRSTGRPITTLPDRYDTWDAFVSGIDVFLAPTHAREPVLDAWNSGVLVVADSSDRDIYEDRALYLGEGGYSLLDDLLLDIATTPTRARRVTSAASRFCVTVASELPMRLTALLHDWK